MHEKSPVYGSEYATPALHQVGVPPVMYYVQHTQVCHHHSAEKTAITKKNARNLLRRETRGEEAVLVGPSGYTPDYLAPYNYTRPP